MSETETIERPSLLDAFAESANGPLAVINQPVDLSAPVTQNVGARPVAKERNEKKILQTLSTLASVAGEDWYYVRSVRISVSGLRGASSVAAVDSDFADRLAVVREWSPEEKRAAIGKVVAAAVDLTTDAASQPPMDDEDVAALVNLVDPAAMRAALIENFDAEDYFGSVSTSVARAAYAEMTGKTLMASAKKAEVASMAAARAKETGWLPAELRTAHYDGPGAAKAGQEAA